MLSRIVCTGTGYGKNSIYHRVVTTVNKYILSNSRKMLFMASIYRECTMFVVCWMFAMIFYVHHVDAVYIRM